MDIMEEQIYGCTRKLCVVAFGFQFLLLFETFLF